MYGIGKDGLGFKYFDGKNLCAVCVYPKIETPEVNMFYWVRPMGDTILDVIKNVSNDIKFSKYIKKLHIEQYTYLKKFGFIDVKDYPWYSTIPAEDDTFPEKILDVKKTIIIANKLGKTRQLNRTLMNFKYYKRNKQLSEASIFDENMKTWNVLSKFFEYIKSKGLANVSTPYDYHNLIYGIVKKDTIIEKLILLDNEPIGFYLAEIQNSKYASLYATITNRKVYNNLTDYIMFDLFARLQDKGVKYLNLGGSEHKSLNDFKDKFRPVESKKMLWLYKP